MEDKRNCHTVTPMFTQRLDSNLRSYFARTRILIIDGCHLHTSSLVCTSRCNSIFSLVDGELPFFNFFILHLCSFFKAWEGVILSPDYM